MEGPREHKRNYDPTGLEAPTGDSCRTESTRVVSSNLNKSRTAGTPVAPGEPQKRRRNNPSYARLQHFIDRKAHLLGMNHFSQ